MAENSNIEWTDHTFNPWIGCTKVSPGCDHCYAETWDARGLQQRETRWGPHAVRTRTSADNWRKPLAWNKAAKAAGKRALVFCASLADVFDNHPSIKLEWRDDLWKLIEATPHLDWLLLTKRPQNVPRFVPGWMEAHSWPLNVWLGTTAENQAEADRRTAHLARIPAQVRFLSCEPLLGRITPNLDGIHWVIVGGESGPGARPMHPDWARFLRDQCQAADVAFFFKQWGEWAPVTIGQDPDYGDIGPAYPMRYCTSDWSARHGEKECLFWQGDDLVHWPHIETFPAIGVRRIGKKAAGRLLDGRTWDQFPDPTTREEKST
jgi:protein gp37